MFKRQKQEFIKQRKYSIHHAVHIANERLIRKKKETERRVRFKQLKLEESIKKQVKKRERRKVKERSEYANKIFEQMKKEKELKHVEKMERIKKTQSILHATRTLLGKKQIDVAFTDGAISAVSNEKMINIGYTDGCIRNLSQNKYNKSNGQMEERQMNLYFTDGTI